MYTSIQEQTFCNFWFSKFDGHVLIRGNCVPLEMASKSHSAAGLQPYFTLGVTVLVL